MADETYCEDIALKPEAKLLRRYYPLLQRWRMVPAEVRLTEVADVMACTPRYARKLLNDMQALGWVLWSSSPGRGSYGHLHCLISSASLQALCFSPPKKSMKTKVAPAPGIGGNNRLIIPFYRPIRAIVPSEHTGRAERHLLEMVHAGLVRLNDAGNPEPDIAREVKSFEGGRRWRFYLRSGLFWHDGTPATLTQICQSLKYHLTRPALQHVTGLALKPSQCLELRLARPDEMLMHRLSNPVYSLAKPGDGEVGLGAFRISLHTDKQLTLERSLYCHRAKPQIEQVEYHITQQCPTQWKDLTVTLPSQPGVDCQHESEASSGFVFIAFNEKSGGLDKNQKALIRQLAQQVARKMLANEQGVLPPPDCVRPHQNDQPQLTADCESISLPPVLRMTYTWTPDNESAFQHLQALLRYYRCRLEAHPVGTAQGFLPVDLSQQDIMMSRMRFQRHWWLSPEFRLRHSVMLQQFMPDALWKWLCRTLDEADASLQHYPHRIKALVRYSLRQQWITPLFSLQFRVLTPEAVSGIKVDTQGWPDFTQMWIKED